MLDEFVIDLDVLFIGLSPLTKCFKEWTILIFYNLLFPDYLT